MTSTLEEESEWERERDIDRKSKKKKEESLSEKYFFLNVLNIQQILPNQY